MKREENGWNPNGKKKLNGSFKKKKEIKRVIIKRKTKQKRKWIIQIRKLKFRNNERYFTGKRNANE